MGAGKPVITSIFSRSTSIPAADTLCPRMIPSLTMKWHLFPNSERGSFLHTLPNFTQVIEAVFETGSINWEIFHEDFHEIFYHIRTDWHHASLESGRGITKTELHSAICECSVRACKGGLFLIVRVYRYLEKSIVSVKKTVILVISQYFQHLINEGQREVIFSGGGV